MTVSRTDRHEYRQGQNDRELPFVERNIKDITKDHPDTEAYYKGRDNEQLDGDKKDDE